MQYGIPGSQYSPPAKTAGKGIFGASGKSNGLFAGNPAMPAPAYPSPYPGLQGVATVQNPNELLAMNARSANLPVPGPSLVSGPVTSTPAMQAPPAPSVSLPPASPSAPYRVQFGAFRRTSSADELAGMINNAGIPVSIFAAPVTGLNVVVTNGGFRTAEEAQSWIDFEGARRGWTERPVVIR